MFKVLIVDDEEIERISMRKILSEAFKGLELKEARNGQMAVDIAKDYRPDIILMDIKMPGLNGLDAIREIMKTAPSVKCIMVTAHDTFEFAREALQLGVKDYLLKPSKVSEIIATVDKVMKEIEKELVNRKKVEKESKQFEKSKRVLETDMVTQLVFDHVHDIHVDTLMEMLGHKELDEFFVMVVIYPKGLEDHYPDLVKRMKTTGNVWVGAASGRQVPMIIFRQKEKSFRTQVTELVKQALRVGEIDEAKEWSVGIGSIYQALNQTKQSYQEALIATMDIKRSGAFRFYEDIKLGLNDGDVLLKKYKEEAFFDHVRLGDWSSIKHNLINLTKCYEKENSPLDYTKQRLMEMIWMIYHILGEMGVNVTPARYFMKDQSYNQLKEEMRFYIDSIDQAYKEMYSDNEQDIIQKIKRYIKDHSHENISLDMLGDKVGLSPIYISKLFKEKLDVNYIDYLTFCRIENAKDKMRDSEKSIKEIAFEVGYHDPNYFSKVFKKQLGVSPKTYQDKLLMTTQASNL